MSLILRVDVDKAFGRRTLVEKVLSKLREEAWFPSWQWQGYGRAAAAFADWLSERDVRGFFSFRLCTLPDQEQVRRLVLQGHQIGLHSENTRSRATFADEVVRFKRRTGIDKVAFFTKHGSGRLKLGRRHYPPYEVEKYQAWSEEFGIPFPFGNGRIGPDSDLSGAFLADMYWIHADYRDTEAYPLEWAVKKAKEVRLPVILHPGNFYAVPQVARDIDRLIELARAGQVTWLTDLTSL